MGIVACDLGPGTAAQRGPALQALVDVGFPCNLGCRTCSRRRATLPDPGALAALCDRICDAVEDAPARTRRVSVAWYGGEPLLDVEGLARASVRVRSACARRDLPYEGSALTNGTLLDERAAALLSRSGIGRVQVSFAGPPVLHDWARPLAGGRSFDRTVGNLIAARTRLELVLRCDISEHCDLRAATDLVRALEQEGLFEPPHAATFLLGRAGSYASQARSLLAIGVPAQVIDLGLGAPDPGPAPAG